MKRILSTSLKLAVLTSLTLSLGACNTLTRLSEVGDDPKLSKIENPVARKDYQPVSMPMPTPARIEDNPNSLWRAGAKAFFKDHRAKEVGDILTVTLDLSDEAKLENSTQRERDDSEDGDLTALLGLPQRLGKNHLQGFEPSASVSVGTQHETSGEGEIDRSEEIKISLAAVVTQILPNGALVIHGTQEIRVNSEIRQLLVTGVVRPQDVESDNTVNHKKIAEMRVAYGGRGTLSELQQPRWGWQVWDILYPF